MSGYERHRSRLWLSTDLHHVLLFGPLIRIILTSLCPETMINDYQGIHGCKDVLCGRRVRTALLLLLQVYSKSKRVLTPKQLMLTFILLAYVFLGGRDVALTETRCDVML